MKRLQIHVRVWVDIAALLIRVSPVYSLSDTEVGFWTPHEVIGRTLSLMSWRTREAMASLSLDVAGQMMVSEGTGIHVRERTEPTRGRPGKSCRMATTDRLVRVPRLRLFRQRLIGRLFRIQVPTQNGTLPFGANRCLKRRRLSSLEYPPPPPTCCLPCALPQRLEANRCLLTEAMPSRRFVDVKSNDGILHNPSLACCLCNVGWCLT